VKILKTSVIAILQGMALLLPAVMASDGVFAQDAKAQRKDQVLRGDAKCTRCHDADDDYPVLSIAQTKHGVRADGRTPTCTSCHGDSETHMNKPEGATERPKPDRVFGKNSHTPVDQRSDACLTCHKGTARTHWAGSMHQREQVTCADCHKTHVSADKVLAKKTQTEVCYTCHKDQRADSHKISTHPIAVGKIDCSDCHNPHGSAGPTLLKKNTVNETCFTCHADKRGPFAFEHLAVVENCANCHTPHGSNISPLLVTRPPWLCQSCHDGQHSSENPLGRNAAGNQAGLTNQSPSNQATGRACLNCHVKIHGSNSPAGGYFQR